MKKFSELELDARLMIWLTAGIFAVAAATAFVLIRQASVMQGQLDEMKSGGEQTDRLIILNTGQMANSARTAAAAQIQADAAKKEVAQLAASIRELHAATEQAERSLQASERPWVTVDVGEKTGNFAVTMRNTGRSPAINVTQVTAFEGGKRMGPPEVDFSRNSSSPIPLPNNAPPEFLESLKKEGYIRDRPPTGYVIAPSAAQIASDYQGKFTQIFQMGGDRVYVQGRVTYDDIFGKPHETIFCYWFAPPSDFVMCKDHNRMN